MGSSLGVHVFLFLSHRLKEASSKYTSGEPEAITYANLIPNVSTAVLFFANAYA
jgi:hypothetical protein